jgi:hypothetical protein
MKMRAKFRCMSACESWDKSIAVVLQPVLRSKTQDPENTTFWDATPSGEMRLTFKESTPFKVGDYYYLDFGRSEDGRWIFSQSTRYVGGGEVQFMAAWNNTVAPKEVMHGNLTMGLSYDALLDQLQDTGSKWDISFVWAEATDLG